MNFQIRTIESGDVSEIFLSVVPDGKAELKTQADDIFTAIRDYLVGKNAEIIQERIFAAADAMEPLSKVRREIYSEIDDGVTPSLLVCKEGTTGKLAAVQIHAVVSGVKPEILTMDNQKCGRVIRLGNITFLTLSGISAPDQKTASKQAQSMFEKAQSIIKVNGGDMLCVPRTWIWLNDLLCWYNDFNAVRNNFFHQCGLIGSGGQQYLPASTGIGLALANGAKCAMDLTAVIKPKKSIHYLPVAGKQHCAYNYGSAFSRAAKAPTPAGTTAYISGTASIDKTGATTNINNDKAQIEETIENVKAVLRDMGCTEKDVVQVMAYCKTPKTEEIFNNIKSSLDWPWVSMVCDVCRDDLLFEIEAAAKVNS